MTTLKDYILHQMRELKREMPLAVEGLSESDLTSREADRSPIAWIVQHCLLDIDFFIHRGITGQFCLEGHGRFREWPNPDPATIKQYLPLRDLQDRWTRLLTASIESLEGIPEERLQEPSRSADPEEPLVKSCLRVINHQNAHLRQIWSIIGRHRLDKWPVQGEFLA